MWLSTTSSDLTPQYRVRYDGSKSYEGEEAEKSSEDEPITGISKLRKEPSLVGDSSDEEGAHKPGYT